ncbi:MAG TPA: prolyl oligopeptidase family serine peptidase, partial [Planctomycetota bacterium]|nr:prolyl oligopeptidase family serine peptidase [Planctomycetota bacterium]
ERVSTRQARRERADDVERERTVWVWSSDDGARTALDWEAWPGAILRPLGWAPQPQDASGSRPPARFALQRTSADRARREVWCFEAGVWRRLFAERDPHWLGGPAGGARWSVDGRALLAPAEWMAGTTTPGRCQLFRVDAASGAVRQMTEVEGELDDWWQADDGRVVLTASRGDPGRRVLLLLAPEGGPAREFELPAGHLDSPRVAGDSVLVRRATLGMPSELWWVAADGSRRAALGETLPRAILGGPRVQPTRLCVTGALGAQVWSHVWLPPGVALDDPDRPRAAVVFVHGAGYLQNVSDSLGEYPVNFLFHERLARMGYVVLDVDYRGSKGYGALFRGEVQHHLGGLDLDDIARSVDELVARGLVDPARVGLYGGSYGGFLTLMALFTQPERWAAGAALRSVTDWRSYHPDYSVPRLGRPSTHPQSYQRSSPIDHAANLRAPLLLLHGMLDSNVFAQDTIRLMEALIDLGLPFEAMLYPSQEHGFEDGLHWLDEYGRIEAFLVGHLGAP